MNDTLAPRFLVEKGAEVEAAYIDQEIPFYQGNPLIEALPPIMVADQVTDRLSFYPPYHPDQRLAPSHLRFHLIQAALRFFAVLPVHLDLERRFSCMIRGGYLGRNPALTTFPSLFHSQGEGVEDMSRYPRSTAHGFTILGISGVGKTRGVEAILSLYPQIVNHTRYREWNFPHRQLVWLKIDCPSDGSIKGLCLNLFQAMDDLLHTRYYELYAGTRRTVDELLPRFTRIAALHSLGVLVVDEIQNLHEASSGGSKRVLNFMVQLINSIGLPVVLVGTYKALSLFTSEFRHTRRGSGQGDLVWDRMNCDAVWQLFTESLWRYQFVRDRVPCSPELNQALYEVTQGITDFAVKVFMLAQVRAIVTGTETITTAIIRSVAEDSLRMAYPILHALKTGNTRLLATVDDVHPIDFDDFVRQELAARRLPPVTTEPIQGTGEPQRVAPVPPPAPPTKRRKKPEAAKFPTGSLPDLAESGLAQQKTGYESLKNAGHIRAAREYL
ncbi:MAG: ATP-binding protein [Blastocatellia bacterium]|nr:ATP-binding protein [Blastocatellia bacterium]